MPTPYTGHTAANCPIKMADGIAKEVAAAARIKTSEVNLKPAADIISANERQNEKILTTLAGKPKIKNIQTSTSTNKVFINRYANIIESKLFDSILTEIQRQFSEMDKRMKRMELNQQKLADKVEANHNEVFEYVDKELNLMWNELSEQVQNKNSEDNEGQSFDKRACLRSTQMRSDNVNKPEVIRIVRDELRKINKANDSNNGSFIDVSRELTETLKTGLSGKGSVLKKDYKLTKQTKFEYFFDFFTSELIANDILYVIDETVKAMII